jgi:hypothetical protein
VNQAKPPARPVANERHPLSTRTYRVATTAIEQCWLLVSKCLQYRIPGALIYGESRLGKTYAIEYLRMLIHCELPCVPTFHVQWSRNTQIIGTEQQTFTFGRSSERLGQQLEQLKLQLDAVLIPLNG